MGQHGITSDHHFTAMPATMWAIYAMVSGTYPRLGRSIVDYGDFHADGLASVLGQHGYETSFIDSYRIDWNLSNGGRHDSRLLRGLGFSNLIETPAVRILRRRRSMDTLRPWRGSGGRLPRRWIGSSRPTRMAPRRSCSSRRSWATTPGAPHQERKASRTRSASRSWRAISMRVWESFSRRSRRTDSTDSVIVVVTGDHGLRTAAEFASVGERMQLVSCPSTCRC